MIACVVMLKAHKFTQELLSLFPLAKTREQLVHIDLKRLIYICLKMIITQKLSKKAHYILVCVFSIQMNGKKTFQHLPFITEECNHGESILMFVEHTDNQILCQILWKNRMKVLFFFNYYYLYLSSNIGHHSFQLFERLLQHL